MSIQSIQVMRLSVELHREAKGGIKKEEEDGGGGKEADEERCWKGMIFTCLGLGLVDMEATSTEVDVAYVISMRTSHQIRAPIGHLPVSSLLSLASRIQIQ